MTESINNPVLEMLERSDADSWATTVNELLPSIHEVDRNATQIWFSFFPLDLFRALAAAADPEKLAAELLLEGRYYLKDQIDSSHTFFYGHRYWPQVRTAILERVDEASAPAPLKELILQIATRAASLARVNQDLVAGITAAGLMTLLHSGIEKFRSAPGRINLEARYIGKSPAQVLKARAKDDSQGLLGFLKTIDQTWTVVFDENNAASNYKAFNLQEIASGAAAEDKQKWRSKDPRCIDGPIPVQCRSAACGTCWVGVLGGAEKLTDVQRLESNSIKRFGYIDSIEKRPMIRLACQAQATGAVSIVIPPWNGVFGKYLKKLKNETEELSSVDAG